MRTTLRPVARMSRRTAGLVVVGLATGLVIVLAVTVISRHKPPAEPAAWAGTVCLALAPWRAEVADLTAVAQTEMGRADTPLRARQTLVSLLSGAERASEIARKRIVGAGRPDVAGGGQAVHRVTTALTRARDAYRHARVTVQGLDANDPKTFYAGVAAAFTTLNREYQASVLDTTTVGPAELRRAFVEVPACR